MPTSLRTVSSSTNTGIVPDSALEPAPAAASESTSDQFSPSACTSTLPPVEVSRAPCPICARIVRESH